MKQSIGVDIGGTKVAVAIINEKGEIVSRRQAPSEVKRTSIFNRRDGRDWDWVTWESRCRKWNSSFPK